MILIAGVEVQDVYEELKDSGLVNADTADDYKVSPKS